MQLPSIKTLLLTKKFLMPASKQKVVQHYKVLQRALTINALYSNKKCPNYKVSHVIITEYFMFSL